jgi:hypothetical protein
MIGAGKAGRIPGIGPAQPVAAVAAHVEKGTDGTGAVPHHQPRVFPIYVVKKSPGWGS